MAEARVPERLLSPGPKAHVMIKDMTVDFGEGFTLVLVVNGDYASIHPNEHLLRQQAGRVMDVLVEALADG